MCSHIVSFPQHGISVLQLEDGELPGGLNPFRRVAHHVICSYTTPDTYVSICCPLCWLWACAALCVCAMLHDAGSLMMLMCNLSQICFIFLKLVHTPTCCVSCRRLAGDAGLFRSMDVTLITYPLEPDESLPDGTPGVLHGTVVWTSHRATLAAADYQGAWGHRVAPCGGRYLLASCHHVVLR